MSALFFNEGITSRVTFALIGQIAEHVLNIHLFLFKNKVSLGASIPP